MEHSLWVSSVDKTFCNVRILIAQTPYRRLKCSQTMLNYHRARCSVIAVKRFSKNVNFNTLHVQQNQSNMSWLHVQEEVMEKYWKMIFGHKPIQIYKSKEYVSHLNCVDSTHIAYALFTLAYNRVKFSPGRFSCCVYPCQNQKNFF